MVLFFIFLSTSLLLSAISITVLHRYAPRIGLVDKPGPRKVHTRPTPMVGGIAIYLSLLYCWVILHFIPGGLSIASVPMLVAITFITLEGAWDDCHDSHARHRFIYHVLVAIIMVAWGGIGINDLGKMFNDQVLVTGFWMAPLTIFAIAGGINANNMIDGIDGLSGGLALVAVTGMIGQVMSSGLNAELYFLAALEGALIGFLLFNLRTPWRKEAKVFLGDSGSMVIGLILAWTMTQLSQGESRVMYPVMALWFFTVPLYDAVAIIVRRLLNSRSPLGADQEHVHHMLLNMGFSVSQTVGILVGINAVFVLTAIVAYKLSIPQYYMFYVFLCIFLIYLYGSERYWRTVKNICPEETSRNLV